MGTRDYGRDLDIGKPTDAQAIQKIALAAQILADEAISDQDMGAADADNDSGR
ncbi:MAG: hypothetical protein WC329_01990 [Candidatus Omnitrophota bacterium]|jgi:hypothetical protein